MELALVVSNTTPASAWHNTIITSNADRLSCIFQQEDSDSLQSVSVKKTDCEICWVILWCLISFLQLIMHTLEVFKHLFLFSMFLLRHDTPGGERIE